MSGHRGCPTTPPGTAAPDAHRPDTCLGRLPVDMTFLTIGEKYSRPELAARWGYESHAAVGKGVMPRWSKPVDELDAKRKEG